MDSTIACRRMDKHSARVKLRDEGSMPAMNSGQRRRAELSEYTLYNQTSNALEINVFYVIPEN